MIYYEHLIPYICEKKNRVFFNVAFLYISGKLHVESSNISWCSLASSRPRGGSARLKGRERRRGEGMRARPEHSGGPRCRRRSHLCAHPRLLGPLLVTALSSRPPQPRGTPAPSVRPRHAALRPRRCSEARRPGLACLSLGPGGGGGACKRSLRAPSGSLGPVDNERSIAVFAVLTGETQAKVYFPGGGTRFVFVLSIRFFFLGKRAARRGGRGAFRGRVPCEAGRGGGLEALCLIGGQGPRRGSARRQRAQRANKRPSLTEPFPEAVAEAVARPRPLAGGLR